MKRSLACIGAFFAITVLVFAASPFEGKLSYEVDNKGRKSDLTFYVKDKMTRFEVLMNNRPLKMIMDWNKKQSFMLMEEQKMAMVLPLEVPENMRKQVDMKGADPVRTGKTKNILGHECELWTISKDNQNVEIWSAKDLGTFAPFAGNQMTRGSMGSLPDISALTNKGDFFPLEIISKDASGKEEFHMTAKSVEKKSLAASVFEIPSDFRLMNSPGMRENAEKKK